MRPLATRWARGVALVVTAALPLAIWPGLATPFSTPKLWVLAAGLATCAALGAGGRRRAQRHLDLLVLAWCVSWAVPALLGDVASFPSLALGVGAALWALVLTRHVPDARGLMRAQVTGSAVMALVASLQWFGRDPFAAAGWVPAIAGASPRLAVYGTLGNPNFVAALAAASLPLAVALAVWPGPGGSRRTPGHAAAGLAAALLLVAVFATGSRAGALALGGSAVTWAALRGGRRRWALVVAGATLAAAAIATSPARPLEETLSGRIYIWRVTWPHAFDRPLTGRDPGAFEVTYPAWERASRPDRRGDRRFIGPQQHAHNDYLEALVERGLPGALVLAGVVSVLLGSAVRRVRAGSDALPVVTGAASLAALATTALVDFPLARPAEAVHFWAAAAIVVMRGEAPSQGDVMARRAQDARATASTSGATSGPAGCPNSVGSSRRQVM